MDVRVIDPQELRQFRVVLGTAFGNDEATETWTPVWENVFATDRMLAAYDEDQIVGTAGNHSFTMTVPGGELPTAGLTVVGVLPTHRRRGIARDLMRAQIDDARKHREPLSILWASEASIYQRFGYGDAIDQLNVKVRRNEGIFIDPGPPSGRVRLLTNDEALKVLPDVYDRIRSNVNGMLARSAKWWEFHRLFDPKEDREGGGPMFKVAWEEEGRAEAYALYRIKEKWNYRTGLPESTLWVMEAGASSATATKELWRYLLSVDLVAEVSGYFMPVDHPLLRMVLEIRRLEVSMNDAVWLRVVDIEEALTARTYADEGALTFELRDDFCDWNAGRWKLTARSSDHSLDRSKDEPDVVIGASELGAVYLGGTSFAEMHRAGRVDETKPGGVARADALFRTDHKPWLPEIF